ncbi:MAG TPA: tetratricopeptide repeat protein [Micropepsaceae bacterium]|nr:tetratricopeptide repeat protein [Micropepsaceae bacterium]
MRSEDASAEIYDALRHGTALHQAGRLDEAERLYRQVLRTAPDQADALQFLGILMAQKGNPLEAAELIDRAISADPSNAGAYYNRGNVLLDLQRFDEAVESYDSALLIRGDHLGALINRGAALQKLNRLQDALVSYERGLALDPNSTALAYNKANTLRDLDRLEEALAAYDRVLQHEPQHLGALNNRGGTFLRMRRYDSALADYDSATALNPTDPDRHYNRGNLLIRMGRGPEALAAYEQALTLSPDFAAARQAHGSVSFGMGDYETAFLDYDAAFRLEPDRDYLEGYRLHAKMHICDWMALSEEMTRLVAHVREGKPAAEPFMLLPVWASAEDQLCCAQLYGADRYPPNPSALWKGEKFRHDEIRIAYMSGEFREQATSYLTADLFECHDRTAFSIYGIGTGANDGSPLRKRLEKGFDVFADMMSQSDSEIAQFIRRSEIDILVNLNGYFGLDRTGVFTMRPAPVQVNYLGYPGTMGAPYMDYIIADPHVIPDDERVHYSESVCYLPDTYQPNDRKKAVSDRIFSRSECALPETGVIFSCFNNNHKILPHIFDVWMRLLAAVDGSVLWLLEGNAVVRRNLMAEAEKRGISSERLVFAPMMPLADHLAREKLADIFLDTLPHNAHTTASDALWCGVPLITCLGSTFAGRVASSLLNAIGLPELITTSLEDYEALALSLARDPALLDAVKAKLARNRDRFPLFDTPRFARYIEDGYRIMWERAARGLPPVSFAVESRRQ